MGKGTPNYGFQHYGFQPLAPSFQLARVKTEGSLFFVRRLKAES
jgi:hypothetical protein